MKTTTLKAGSMKRKWHHFDIEGKVLGRAATQIVILLLGKNTAEYAPNLDTGGYVVVTNAALLKVTGKKLLQKNYYRHSGFPGGFKEVRLDRQLAVEPTKVVRHAVAGMLPKNKLRSRRLARLKIFAGSEHPYQDKLKK